MMDFNQAQRIVPALATLALFFGLASIFMTTGHGVPVRPVLLGAGIGFLAGASLAVLLVRWRG